jgi:uncharacterized delta-60 repeat protein
MKTVRHSRLASLLAALAMLAFAGGPASAETIPLPCKNHYILSQPCEGEKDNSYFYVVARVTKPDGKSIAVGGARPEIPGGYQVAIEIRNPNGSLDATFSGGFVTVPVFGYYEFGVHVALAADGSIFVGGNATHPFWSRDPVNCYPAFCGFYPFILKLRPDGTLDPTFNGSGRLVLDMGGVDARNYDVPDDATLRSLSVQPDGKILVEMVDRTFGARINPDGSIDTSLAVQHPVEKMAIGGNFQGLWWGGASQAGSNLHFSHQGDILFATWATYDATGRPTWLSMTANQSGPSAFTGTLYKSSGPALAYEPGRLTMQAVGQGSVFFNSTGEARFTYTRSGVERRKPIVKFGEFGSQPPCAPRERSDLSRATNLTDLWVADPVGSEPGWAVGIAHVADQLLVTWLRYDVDRAPLWLYGVASYTHGDFAGTLFRTVGKTGAEYDSTVESYAGAGPLTIEVTDGNHITFNTFVDNAPWSHRLTRYVFRGNGTTCGN